MERIICILTGYVFGLFQTGYFIGKLHHTDIRSHGSGNAGSTNVLRTFGKSAGILTLVGDCMKCVLAILITTAIFSGKQGDMIPLLKVYTAAGVVLGHNFPFYLNFKGGKGVAASLGFLAAFDWRTVVVALVVFVAVVAISGYVSLASLSAYSICIVVIIIFGQLGSYGMNMAHRMEMYGALLCLGGLAFYSHRANLKRLAAGTESRFSFGNGKGKKSGK